MKYDELQHVREGDLCAPCHTRNVRPEGVLRFQCSSKVRALHTTLRPAGHRILASMQNG